MLQEIYEEKERNGSYNDFTNSEGVLPVIFLKELLNEAFELKPQSNAKAKKVLFLFFPEAIRRLNSSMRYELIKS
jgi:hypothetical protein